MEQARHTVEQTRQLVVEKAPVVQEAVQEAVRQRPVPVAAVAGGALLLLVAFLVRRRRSGPA